MTAAPSLDQIRSARFRAEREPGWKRLDALVLRSENNGLRSLGYDEAQELASLYRQAMNALSVARAISMDKALLTYLDALCARAYLVVYAPQESLHGLFTRLISHGIPQAARRSGPALLIGFVAMLLVTGISLLGVMAALFVAAAFMLLGGLFAMVFKLLPWLILAVIGVWIYRSMQKPQIRRY